MSKDHLDELWARPTSWKCGGIYCCKEDPRAIVPKRIRWAGWTVNFAHWYSWVALVLLLAALVAPLLAEMALGVTSPAVIVPTGLASVVAVCVISHLASRAR